MFYRAILETKLFLGKYDPVIELAFCPEMEPQCVIDNECHNQLILPFSRHTLYLHNKIL